MKHDDLIQELRKEAPHRQQQLRAEAADVIEELRYGPAYNIGKVVALAIVVSLGVLLLAVILLLGAVVIQGLWQMVAT